MTEHGLACYLKVEYYTLRAQILVNHRNLACSIEHDVISRLSDLGGHAKVLLDDFSTANLSCCSNVPPPTKGDCNVPTAYAYVHVSRTEDDSN